MKIDLHVHTAHSYDASGTPEEVLDRAAEVGLDGLAITEHDSYEKSRIFLELAPRYDLVVFAGAEVATRDGHYLVFSEDSERWNRCCDGHMDTQALIDEVNSCGGAVVAAHPYRYGSSFSALHLERLRGLAAIEACNGANLREENRRALDLARSLALPVTGGSDAHRIEEIGRCYTVFTVPVRNTVELVSALKAGRCRCVDTGRQC